jgi:hypothetical protein
MLGRLVRWLFLVAIAVLIVQSLPDLERYLRIREM